MLIQTRLDVSAISLGLLIARLVVGLGIAAHGAQKLFGWFGGHGLEGTAGYLDSLGFRPGRTFATAAAVAEFGGGVLVALGFLGPIGPAVVLAVMLVAMTQHWSNGFFSMNGGIELPLLYATAGVALAFTGPGAYSLDAALGLTGLSTPTVETVVIILAVLGAAGSLAARRSASAASR
ncbi:MAG TPA: DoxX family protein [Gemmatimonadales bacterium]|nr:DoxX family protein [Gemmatimonadales bacterium]